VNKTGRLGGQARRVLGFLAAVALTGVAVMPAGAQTEQEAFDDVRAHRAWTAWTDSRPVSPFVGIPFEFTFGVPFTRSFLDSTPGRSEAFAAPYYADEVIEETYEASGYKNVTLARSNFPDTGRGSSSKWEASGADGPRASTNTPSRTEAEAEARNGFSGGAGTLSPAGSSRTKSLFDRKDLVVNEASGAASNVQLGDAGLIGHVESMVKVEHTLGQEPLITYRLTLAGVQAGGQEIVGYGRDGITLAGNKVAGSELAEQFNAQMAENGDALEEMVAKLTLRVFAPNVEKHDDGGYLVTGPVAWFRSDNTFRDNQTGDNFGLRLGYMRAYSYLIDVQA